LPELEIRRIAAADAGDVAQLLSADPREYAAGFDPFPADAAVIAAELATADRDRYWAIMRDGELAAFVMLRGLDAGFSAPAFGVYVAMSWSGRGLGRLALAYAEAWSRANGLAELMLTVEDANHRARVLYESSGFRFEGEHSPRGHLIYRKQLNALHPS
jgi:RimJ/RimL family protein N-acetyltransferase